MVWAGDLVRLENGQLPVKESSSCDETTRPQGKNTTLLLRREVCVKRELRKAEEDQNEQGASGIRRVSLDVVTFLDRGFRRHKHLLFGRARFANEASRRQYTCGHVIGLPRKSRANLTWKSGRREGEFPRRIVTAPAHSRSVDGDFRRDEADSMAMDAGAAVKVSGNMTFAMQIGLVREAVTVTVEGGAGDLTMATLKDIACAFVDRKFPEHGLYGLEDKILLFRHEQNNPNILKHVDSISEVVADTLIEVVLSANTTMEELQIRPHILFVHSYKSPHFCDFCGEMLFGIVRQGLKCEGCGLNFHKRCAYKIPNNCTHMRRRHSTYGSSRGNSFQLPPETTIRQNSQSSFSQLCAVSSKSSSSLSIPTTSSMDSHNSRPKSWSGRPLWLEKEYAVRIKVPHTFVVHNYKRPTVCQLCKKLLRGLFRQGLQCKDCKFNCHKKCAPQVPKNCQGEVKWVAGSIESCPGMDMNDTDLVDDLDNSQSPLSGDQEEDDEDSDHKPPLSPNESNNIPLMRVVQSVKNTKRAGSNIIREGWMVHFTNRDNLRKRHYWKLDTKSITMYQKENESRYFKDVPLSEISQVELARSPQSIDATRNPHVFEFRINSTVYYVGEDPTCGGQEESTMTSVESGVGLEQARSWENAIRQALMPVTARHSPKGDANAGRGISRGSTTGTDIAKLYKIFPDDVLGSGQFGIVYGGKHRTEEREVAIKVIDKLRFPTKQEAQLKNEVAILQNLHHPGVVDLEKMLETPERIFVVMEKLKGDMLEMILSSPRGRLTERLTKFLVSQVNPSANYVLIHTCGFRGSCPHQKHVMLLATLGLHAAAPCTCPSI
ncbi:Serine/threonine-protein kinase D3 [Lamellibrachia satsuma]|nr:Serine/threonine-protein kinase D3 [Lamellibrachia satsuma]